MLQHISIDDQGQRAITTIAIHTIMEQAMLPRGCNTCVGGGASYNDYPGVDGTEERPRKENRQCR